ncbi:hypothetical protein H5P36_21075 [Bacillus sp. APMAM]|nr:hypothetical protein [Bacillus sp. APMAM]RTZ53896.1 hypothetical protein EKO25_20825 [Bacillus sp. SAJ1]
MNKKLNMTEAVEKAAALKRDATTQKVTEALNKLKKSKKKLTISAVAREANVSNKTIYNRKDLKAMIDEAINLRTDKEKAKDEKPVPTKGSTTQTARIEKMRTQIRDLKQEKMEILEQNAQLTDMVLKLKREMAELEGKLYTQSEFKVVEMKKK